MSLEKMLPGDAFLRVHKYFIVAINKITEIEGNQIKLRSKRIPVGRTYKMNVDRLQNNP